MSISSKVTGAVGTLGGAVHAAGGAATTGVQQGEAAGIGAGAQAGTASNLSASADTSAQSNQDSLNSSASGVNTVNQNGISANATQQVADMSNQQTEQSALTAAFAKAHDEEQKSAIGSIQ